MQAIESPDIAQMAADLARNLLPVLKERWQMIPRPLATLPDLAALLAPGVAAFAGRLMTLAPGEATLTPNLLAFFAAPATAAAFDRYAAGEAGGDELYDLLLGTGLPGSGMLRSYIEVAIESLLAAAEAVLRRELPSPSREAAGEPAEPAYFGHPNPYLLDEMKQYAANYDVHGLGRVELGRTVGDDGLTELMVWEPAPMAGPPPQEGGQSAEPEEMPTGAEPEEVTEAIGGASTVDLGETAAPLAVPPPAPPAAPTEEAVVALRLDAALPEQVVVGRVFDLAVAVKRPASPVFAPDDLTRRESADFAAVWPADALFVQIRIQISAPDCTIHGGDSRPLRLPAGQDGPPVYFQLTPLRAGPLSVIITVYQETDWIGSTRLRTEAAGGEVRGAMALTLDSQPLPGPEVNQQTLWKALSEGYNESELRDLCFELSIDYEDLPGDTKSAKARELVLHAKRHGLIARLVEQVMVDRPQLLAPAN
ncbi:MAG: hypothetical protein KA170_00500 [Candidatus Promineofilum sp.]|nr:hypothetical protein [Promineifilum sp.]